MASIREVAKMAGVSVGTVSNVLNGRLEKVSAETREKVWTVVRTLGYRPTPMEHKQKAILSLNLGVMVPDLSPSPITQHGYFRSVLDGALETAALRGWSVTIFVERMWDDVGHAVRRSYDGRCDGLIAVAPQPGNEVVESLVERGTPEVIVGTTPWLGNVSLVDVDNTAIGAEAARFLMGLGHRCLGYYGEEHERVSSVERRESFFEEAAKIGALPEDLHWIWPPKADEAAQKLLGSPDRPTGILCWHDSFALELIAELKRRGCRIPEDISVIGVNDSPEAREYSPSLTTFRNPITEMGKRAARIIIDHCTAGSDATELVRLPAELILRESAGRAPCRS